MYEIVPVIARCTIDQALCGVGFLTLSKGEMQIRTGTSTAACI